MEADWSNMLWSWRKRPQAKEYRQPVQAEKGKETDFPLRASGRNQPCQHFAFSPVQLISDLHLKNYKRVNLCCFQIPVLWQFVTGSKRTWQ